MIEPVVDDEGRPFWEGTAAGALRVQCCATCGLRRFPPRPMCPRCRSVDAAWEAMSGRGTVWSFLVGHPPLLPELSDGFNAVVVALDEDPSIRLIGNLVAEVDAPLDSVDPATITIGMRVEAVFPRTEGGVHLVRWTPVPDPV